MPRTNALFVSGGATATFQATVPADLGTIASQNASSVAITGGTVTGLTSFGFGTATPATSFHVATTSDVLVGGATKTSNGALYYTNPLNGAALFGIYDPNNSVYFGISQSLPVPAGWSTLGGYYKGLAVAGSTSGKNNPIFGVLSSSQSGNGKNNTAFTIYDTNVVVTFKTTIDDGSGNMAVGGALTVATAPAAADSSASVPTTAFLTSYTLRGDIAQTWSPILQAQALANLGAASALSVTNLAGRTLSRGRILALAIAN